MKHMPDATIYVISDPPLPERLGLDFHISEEPKEIDIVVVSCDREFNFHKLNTGFQALRRGAWFLAVNTDATYPFLEGELPDKVRESASMYAGCIAGALQQQEYLDVISGAGFNDVEIKSSKEIIVPEELLRDYLSVEEYDEYKSSGAEIKSITVVGYKK